MTRFDYDVTVSFAEDVPATPAPPRAWHGNPALKEEAVLRLKEHRAKDEIIRGLYQEVIDERFSTQSGLLDVTKKELQELEVALDMVAHKGCAVGCTLPLITYDQTQEAGFSWHRELEKVYGIDARVADLIDDTFESQASFEGAAKFAVEVIEAIPVGADLSGIDCRTNQYGPRECGRCVGCRANYETARRARSSAARLIKALKKAPVPVQEDV